MKIDHNYLKKLLEACQIFEMPTFDIGDLEDAGFDHNDKQFEFHMGILTDQKFIQRDDGHSGYGLVKSVDGFPGWAVVPLRLTASGHEFIEALSNKEVWETIKLSFKDASITTLKTVSFRLLEGYAMKKIDELLN